jgi:hypothetical protein
MAKYIVTPNTPPAGPLNAPRPDPGARGFQVNAADLIRAQEPARIDARGFVAEAGAGFGPALQSAGKQATTLYKEHVDSVTKEQTLNADASLQAARLQIAARLAGERNTLRWEAIGIEEADKWEKEVLSDPDLTPDAKANIAGVFTRWKQTEIASIKYQAAAVQAKRTGEAFVGSIIDMQASGNFEGANLLIKKGRKENIVDDDTGARMEAQNQAAALKQAESDRLDSDMRYIRMDPDRAIAELNQEGSALAKNRTEVQRKELYDYALEMKRERGAMVSNDILNRMAMPPVVNGKKNPDAVSTAEDVEEYAKTHPEFTPYMKAKALADIKEMQVKGFKERMQIEGPQIASRIWTLIDRWDPKGANAQNEYFQWSSDIQKLPEGKNRTDVLNKLEARWEGRQIKAGDARLHYGEKVMTEMFDKGAFGAFDHWSYLMTDKGKQIMDPRTNLPERVYTRNQTDFDNALSAKAKLGEKLREYLESKPDATIDDVKEFIWKNKATATLGGTYSALQSLYQTAAAVNAVPAPIVGAQVTPGVPDRDPKGALPPGDSAPVEDDPLPPIVLNPPPPPKDKTVGGDSMIDPEEARARAETDAAEKKRNQRMKDSTSGLKTHVITEAEIKKAPKDGYSLIDPDTGNWIQVGPKGLRTKKWIVPESP